MKVLNPEAAARIQELEKEIAKIKHDALSECQKRDVYIDSLDYVYGQLTTHYDDSSPLCVLVDEAPETHRFLIESGIEKGLDKVLAMLFDEVKDNMHK